jgi:apolipoprotein N-acyltransferase
VFGEEMIRALPAATVLVNVTNDGWFGHSPAAAQHNQMAQFRAMETGRMMLRATNTGMTSIIGVHGQILQQIPPHQVGTLTGMAQGYQGTTPYIIWGNFAVWALFGMMLGVAGWLVKRSKIKSGDSDVL